MKMGKKRSSEDSAESNTPEKTEKVPEFNGTVFKAMLKEPTTAMKGECICTVCCKHLAEVILSHSGDLAFIHVSILPARRVCVCFG